MKNKETRILIFSMIITGIILCPSLYAASSSSYNLGPFQFGLTGGTGESSSYTMRFTTTYQETGDLSCSSLSYTLNSGWLRFSSDTGLKIFSNLTDNGYYSSRDFSVRFNVTGSNLSKTWYYLSSVGANITSLNTTNQTENFTLQTDGQYYITLYANDTSGNLKVKNLTFTVDTTRPYPIETNISNGQYLNTNAFTIDLKVSDTNLANIWFSYDSGSNSTPLSANGTGEISSLADGSHYLEIWANDSATNINYTNISFTVDTIRPYPIETNISNGQYLNTDTFTIDLKVSDVNLDNIWYSYDGGSNSTPQAANSTGFISSLTDGSHYLEIWANDSATNINFTNISFTVDRTQPYPIETNISNGQYINTDTFSIDLKASDANLANIWFSYDGGSNSTPLAANGTGAISSLADGSHYLEIWANDSATNINYTNISFIVDTTQPYPIETNISNGQYLNTDTFTIDLKVSDVNLDNIWYSYDGGSNSTPLSANGTGFISGLAEGLHYFEIWANDSSTNINFTNISLTVDTIRPYPIETNISDGQYLNINTFSIDLKASDTNLANIWFSYDGGSNSTPLSANGTGALSSLNDGSHYFEIWANDSGANFNFTNTSFTVDTINPKSFTNVTSGATYGTRDISIQLNASDVNIDRIWYSLDGGSNSTPYTTNTTTANLSLSDGSHYIVIYVNDSVAHMNITNVSFSLDYPPIITFVSPTPSNNFYLENTWFYVNITTDQTSDTAWIELENSTQTTNTTLNGSGTNWYYNNTNLSQGNHNLRVWANDSGSNLGMSEIRTIYRVKNNTVAEINATFNETTVVVNNSDLTIEVIPLTNTTVNLTARISLMPVGTPDTLNGTTTNGKAERAIKYLVADNRTSLSNLSNLTLKLHYNDSDISGLDESSLALYYWNGSMWLKTIEYINQTLPGGPIVFDAGVNITGNYVYAVVDHLSFWSLGGNPVSPPSSGNGGGSTSHGFSISELKVPDPIKVPTTVRIFVDLLSEVSESGAILKVQDLPEGWKAGEVRTGPLKPGVNRIEFTIQVPEDTKGTYDLILEIIPIDFLGAVRETIEIVVGDDYPLEGEINQTITTELKEEIDEEDKIPVEPEKPEVDKIEELPEPSLEDEKGIKTEEEKKSKGICGPIVLVFITLIPVYLIRRWI